MIGCVTWVYAYGTYLVQPCFSGQAYESTAPVFHLPRTARVQGPIEKCPKHIVRSIFCRVRACWIRKFQSRPGSDMAIQLNVGNERSDYQPNNTVACPIYKHVCDQVFLRLFHTVCFFSPLYKDHVKQQPGFKRAIECRFDRLEPLAARILRHCTKLRSKFVEHEWDWHHDKSNKSKNCCSPPGIQFFIHLLTKHREPCTEG